MAIFTYNPFTDFRKGSNKRIASQGFVPSPRRPLSISSQGFIEPFYNAVDILTGGEADTTLIPFTVYEATGIIYVDGASAPTVAIIDNLVSYNYEPIGGLNTGGAAPFTIDDDGVLVYNYPSTGSGVAGFGGIGDINIDLGAAAAGGISVNGAGDIVFFPKKERGGRGGALDKRIRVRVPHYWIWYAPALSRFAIKTGGSATCEFVESPLAKHFTATDLKELLEIEELEHETSFRIPLEPEVVIEQYDPEQYIRDVVLYKKTTVSQYHTINESLYSKSSASLYEHKTNCLYDNSNEKQYVILNESTDKQYNRSRNQYHKKSTNLYQSKNNHKLYQ